MTVLPLADTLLTTFGFFILLGEEECPAMGQEFWSRTHDPRLRSREIERLQTEGRALQWTLLLDGTFLLSFNVIDGVEPAEIEGFSRTAGSLVLPRGALAVRSGAEQPSTLVGLVARGRYRVYVDWSPEKEALHSDIERVDDYPVGDGPDGIVWLQLVETIE